jgi:hypothetical protein
LTQVNLSVRVPAKMRLDLLLGRLDLGSEGGQDRGLEASTIPKLRATSAAGLPAESTDAT